ncbi:NAD-dependent epimerase/dehydratase family protein [Nesterenkonia populi]|uniref:NAD-dependent epimerase/dehydratase family protein n=1 Tax=Nesterenkonia populi TaxID=1591087 RepID=UPI0011BDA82D|nr:NAD-dependent epimerase/dehydratase family protein [Nesterenkonia populi]
MSVLVTGSAGFIGAAVADSLLRDGFSVVGLDNHSHYYDPSLKEARVRRLATYPRYSHYRVDLCDHSALDEIVRSSQPGIVVHLAAQAGVRYSLKEPRAYANSNIVGFVNILEASRSVQVEHFVYASSSSVYGANKSLPFSTKDNVDHPLNLYAATKKSNELLAHSYSHLFNMPTTGLRFFTVYGPWGRPDMAPYKFVKSALEGRAIDVYNFGDHQRDFTYIDDVVEGVRLVMEKSAQGQAEWDGHAPDPASSAAPWRVLNIGNSNPVDLMEFISAVEEASGVTMEKNLLPMQPGDMRATYADVSVLQSEFGYRPNTSVRTGVRALVNWYEEYYGL